VENLSSILLTHGNTGVCEQASGMVSENVIAETQQLVPYSHVESFQSCLNVLKALALQS